MTPSISLPHRLHAPSRAASPQSAADAASFATLPVTVREASPAERSRWDDLVTRFDNYELAQKAAWVRSLEVSGLGAPIFLLFERGDRLVGCLPGLVTRKGPIRIFGSPLAGWQTAGMGPAFDRAAVSTAEMIDLLVDHLERRRGVHHIELISGALDHDAMRARGFRGQPVTTFRCPLYREEAAQMKALKDSARRNIRRAQRLGIVVRFEDDERFVDEHYDQVKEVFRRGGNAVPFRKQRALAYFREMRASGSLLAVGAYLRDESQGEVCIATGMFTLERNELALWTWTHRGDHRWYRPTELMTWTVMRRAAAAGANTFDMMGRGDFKTRFGAELDGARWRWVRSRYAWLATLRDLAEIGYRRQQSLRGRLARGGERLLAELSSWRSGTRARSAEDHGGAE